MTGEKEETSTPVVQATALDEPIYQDPLDLQVDAVFLYKRRARKHYSMKYTKTDFPPDFPRHHSQSPGTHIAQVMANNGA
jgi:hypothetical protein